MSGKRERLAHRRPGDAFEIIHEGQTYRVQVGRYPDGRAGEIFVDVGKSGTSVNVLALDAAIAASFALQHGCPVETLRRAFHRERSGKPAGAFALIFDRLLELDLEWSEFLAGGVFVE